jgi:hypothetical protein
MTPLAPDVLRCLIVPLIKRSRISESLVRPARTERKAGYVKQRNRFVEELG